MPGMGQGQGQGMMPGTGPGMMQNQGQGQGPGMMPGMGQGMGMDMMENMTALTGARLEASFMTMMIPHHQGAITMSQLAPDRAVHPELKQLAQQIIDAQTGEIGQFNQWLAAWYNL